MNVISKFLIIISVLFMYSCNENDNPIPDNQVPDNQVPDSQIPDSQDYGMLNLDFEIRSYNNASFPDYWYVGGEGFKISLDDVERHSGKLSLKLVRNGNPDGKYGVFNGSFPIETVTGCEIEYKGWIKTKEVINGYAGLWFRVDGAHSTLGFENMNNRGLQGNNNWTQVSIKMNVSPDATGIYFGGLFPGEGTVWFDHLELYINGVKYIDHEPKTSLLQEEIAALEKYIYPLRTYNPDGGDTKDLEVLDKLIGNSKVVALGEVSHGSSEIFKMKNRIIQYLAINNGFDIFSIEANMPESYKLNNYTVRGEGDPKKLIAGMYFWTWRTEEVLNMVEWMHRFNQPNQRIAFTGFDMQYYIGAVDEIQDAFKENYDVNIKIGTLRTKLAAGYANISVNDRKEIDAILSFLQNSIEISSFQISERKWLQQNIVIIQQYLGLGSNNRDKCMADNIMWIKDQNPDSKLVIWAHNGHIKETKQVMGYHLAQKLGEDYTTFGFTFLDGFFTAAGSNGLTSYQAEPAYSTTLEYWLNQINEPIFIIDLKKIKSDKSKDTEWLLKQITYRSVGSMGGLGRQGEFNTSKISDDFDYLIFIKASTPSVLLPL